MAVLSLRHGAIGGASAWASAHAPFPDVPRPEADRLRSADIRTGLQLGPARPAFAHCATCLYNYSLSTRQTSGEGKKSIGIGGTVKWIRLVLLSPHWPPELRPVRRVWRAMRSRAS